MKDWYGVVATHTCGSWGSKTVQSVPFASVVEPESSVVGQVGSCGGMLGQTGTHEENWSRRG